MHGRPTVFRGNYIKIVSLDEGIVPFKLFPFQKDIVGTLTTRAGGGGAGCGPGGSGSGGAGGSGIVIVRYPIYV
jgi:hypothetical protein